jgi:RND family efflux transporter MFP subunit
MSFGSPTPIELAVQGINLQDDYAYAQKVQTEFAKLSFLRDLQFAQEVNYPTLDINVSRDRAGQFGLTMADVVRSVVPATSSSRFTQPNYWRDPNSGNAFQIQVQLPQNRVQSVEDLRELPVMQNGRTDTELTNIADLKLGTMPGVIERNNGQRVISLTANLSRVTLGESVPALNAALARVGTPPRGISIKYRGQIPPLEQTISGLRVGLLLAILVIFLLLAANFQSIRLALAIILTVPAVLCGVLLMLRFTGTTLNIQSFMGAIMSIGIAVANSILLVTFAERFRHEGRSLLEATREGATGRLRAILMTAAAMIFGMVPIAIGFGEGGAQSAPLGRALLAGFCCRPSRRLRFCHRSTPFYKTKCLPLLHHSTQWIPRAATMKRPRIPLVLASWAFLALVCAAPSETGSLAPVLAKPVSLAVDLPGEIAPFLSVSLHAKVQGYVDRVLVDRGSVVKQGDLLVELSAPEMAARTSEAESKLQAAHADRLQAEAQLAAAQSSYDRMKQAADTPGAIGGNELIQAQQQMDSAKALLNSRQQASRASEATVRALRDLQSYLKITAPFDGVVTERLVHPGALVGPDADSVLLILRQVSHLRLVVAVPEENVGAITRGSRATFTVPAHPDRTYSGTVARIARALDQKTRTMAVELDVWNPDGFLAPGMYSTVKWPVQRKRPALFVPKSSVVTTTERTFVIREQAGRAHWVDVKKGVVEGDLIEVTGELQAGEMVVRRGTDELSEGTVLRSRP